MKHKKITVLIVLLLMFTFGANVLAQGSELPKAGLTPDSPFYFLEKISEDIRTFFTFGDLKKAERYAALAAERLAEAKAVVEKGKPELAEKTMVRYEKQLNNSIARAKKAILKAKSVEKALEVMTKVGKATSKHLEVLAEVYEKVPEQAKPAIEKAMKASLKGHEKAVAVLKEKNTLGEVPEKVSLPVKVPGEVRERIQRKVQQELKVDEALERMREEVLQGNSKSLRTLCTESGGKTEMCEKLPPQGFKSFKAFKTFCLEMGGVEELCTSFEAMCKEYGITAADECFRALSSTTSTTIESSIAPVIEEPKGN